MRPLHVSLLVAAWLSVAVSALAWDDRTADLDMPWVGKGGRARMFHDRSTCFMCPTGYTDRERWGRSAWSGEDPYVAVGDAMRFLRKTGTLDAWPEALGEGSVGGEGSGIIHPRAAPYRFTVVMIQPTVVVMRYDLGALVKLGGAEHAIGTPYLNQGVEYGTRIPATGMLLWFSPETGEPPARIALTTPDHGEIVVKGTRLVLDRRGDEWIVGRP